MEKSKIIPIVIDISHLRSLIVADKSLLSVYMEEELGVTKNHFIVLPNNKRCYMHILMKGFQYEKPFMIKKAYEVLTSISEKLSKVIIEELFNKNRTVNVGGADMDPYKGLDLVIDRLLRKSNRVNLWTIINTILHRLSDKNLSQSFVVQSCLTRLEGMVMEKKATIEIKGFEIHSENLNIVTSGEPLQPQHLYELMNDSASQFMDDIVVNLPSFKPRQ